MTAPLRALICSVLLVAGLARLLPAGWSRPALRDCCRKGAVMECCLPGSSCSMRRCPDMAGVPVARALIPAELSACSPLSAPTPGGLTSRSEARRPSGLAPESPDPPPRG